MRFPRIRLFYVLVLNALYLKEMKLIIDLINLFM